MVDKMGKKSLTIVPPKDLGTQRLPPVPTPNFVVEYAKTLNYYHRVQGFKAASKYVQELKAYGETLEDPDQKIYYDCFVNTMIEVAAGDWRNNVQSASEYKYKKENHRKRVKVIEKIKNRRLGVTDTNADKLVYGFKRAIWGGGIYFVSEAGQSLQSLSTGFAILGIAVADVLIRCYQLKKSKEILTTYNDQICLEDERFSEVIIDIKTRYADERRARFSRAEKKLMVEYQRRFKIDLGDDTSADRFFAEKVNDNIFVLDEDIQGGLGI